MSMSTPEYWLKPRMRWLRLDMTEKLLSVTLNHNSKKETNTCKTTVTYLLNTYFIKLVYVKNHFNSVLIIWPLWEYVSLI